VVKRFFGKILIEEIWFYMMIEFEDVFVDIALRMVSFQHRGLEWKHGD
jgi:hypothetical protein